MATLHIVNGESTLGTLREAFPGEDAFSWFDFLMEGPPPDGTDEGWRRRAEALARRFGLEAASFLSAQRAWDERLHEAGRYGEVVLWFEGDLFCAFNLAYLLAWFRQHGAGRAALSLVCPLDERLGTLEGKRLAQLFGEREPITADLLEAGSAAWQELTASEPTLVAPLRRVALFERAVRLQQQRLPAASGASSALEQHLVGLLDSEPQRLGLLFKSFCQTELGYQMGMGDRQWAVLLVDLHWRGLVRIDPEPGFPPYEDFGAWQVRLAA
jgi:hypothetical protein